MRDPRMKPDRPPANTPDDLDDEREARDVPPALAGLVVRVRVPVYPTEDESAVRRAVSAVLPRVPLERAGENLQGVAQGPVAFARLRRRLREQQIRDAARAYLHRCAKAGPLCFMVNKQAATRRVVSFATDGSPLGDIEVRAEGAEPEQVIDWLCELGGG
jgi:predicted RNA binding protein with dsRBD fold (UPF0201 family)